MSDFISKFNNLMQDVVNLEYDQLLALGKSSLIKLMPYFNAVDPDQGATIISMAIFNAITSADGVLSTKEKKFISDLLGGLDISSIETIYNIQTGKEQEFVKSFYQALPSDAQAELFKLVAAIAAADETIDKSEATYIASLFFE